MLLNFDKNIKTLPIYQDGEDDDSDKDWNSPNDAESDTDEDKEYEEENVKNMQCRAS